MYAPNEQSHRVQAKGLTPFRTQHPRPPIAHAADSWRRGSTARVPRSLSPAAAAPQSSLIKRAFQFVPRPNASSLRQTARFCTQHAPFTFRQGCRTCCRTCSRGLARHRLFCSTGSCRVDGGTLWRCWSWHSSLQRAWLRRRPAASTTKGGLTPVAQEPTAVAPAARYRQPSDPCFTSRTSVAAHQVGGVGEKMKHNEADVE